MTDTSNVRNQLARRAEETDLAETNGAGPPTINQLINQQRVEIARALPKHMDADRLARIALTVVKQTPRLMECTAESLLGALMLSAQTGLEPGPLQHAYFIPRWNGREKHLECQWQIGYKGIIELARRSGKIRSIEAREVCANDHFEFAYGLEEKLDHQPYMQGDRGVIVAFWGLAKFTDGGHYFVVMSVDDVNRHRDRSDSFKKGYGPWVDDYAAMGRKTLIRVMAPFLPLAAEQAATIAHDGAVHTSIDPDMVDRSPDWIDTDAAPVALPAPPTSKPDDVDGDDEDPDDDPDGPGTGETYDDEAPFDDDGPDETWTEPSDGDPPPASPARSTGSNLGRADEARARLIRSIGMMRDKAFPCDDAPRGQKTKRRDRLAHAFTFAITARASSLNDCTVEELTRIQAAMCDLLNGTYTYEADDLGVTFRITGGSKPARVTWAQVAA